MEEAEHGRRGLGSHALTFEVPRRPAGGGPVRLAFFGHSGSGKSTVASLTEQFFAARGLPVARVKLAEPLYQLQRRFYAVAGRPIGLYEQDHVLLEAIASQLRRISATSLIDDFERRLAVAEVEAGVVVNDDVRDPFVDAPRLGALGFTFIRVHCDEDRRLARLTARADRSSVAHSSTTRDLELLPQDRLIDNSLDELADLEERLHEMLRALL